jgi:manganese/zinc/iron transport system substrate-binding protein
MEMVWAKSTAWRRILLSGVWIVIMLTLAACGGQTGNSTGTGKLQITATIGMVADVVKNVGGEHVEVQTLMGEGTDPHVYKASQGDIRKLNSAELIFYNGLHLEAAMAEVLDQMTDKVTVAVGEELDPALLLDGDPASGGAYDPHIWFDVTYWMMVTEVIRDTLKEEDPEQAAVYDSNAKAYLAELEALDQYVKEQIATIPEQSRVLVTAHDAFGYFGKAYGIEVRGLQGISTASEAGVKDVSDLREYLIENSIKSVFVESSISSKSIEAVIEGAKAKGHTIEIGGKLFADAMGEAGTEEGTYIGMVRHNVDTIVAGLK